jgi:hypothetical protein
MEDTEAKALSIRLSLGHLNAVEMSYILALGAAEKLPE